MRIDSNANGFVSTGSSANSLNDEHWLNLALELKPLDEMVGDRDKLMEEVFAILGGDQQLQELLPDVIKKANHSSDEIRELLGKPKFNTLLRLIE